MEKELIKECSTCENILPISAFAFRKDTKKYRNICRVCQNKQIYDRNHGIVKTGEDLLIISEKKQVKKKIIKSKRAKIYRETNKEKVKAAKKKYYDENKHNILAKQKLKYNQNKEKINKRSAQWKIKNKGAVSNYTRARELRKRQAMPKWADTVKIKQVYERARRFELWLNTSFHVDHIIPLNNYQVCGLHNEFNLQILTREQNLLKSNKFDSDDFNDVYLEGMSYAD